MKYIVYYPKVGIVAHIDIFSIHAICYADFTAASKLLYRFGVLIKYQYLLCCMKVKKFVYWPLFSYRPSSLKFSATNLVQVSP